MDIKPETLYHIYNRGNNSQRIFFIEENYSFFLRKTEKELLPFCDILAYCLMPTHFHFLVYAKELTAVTHRMTPNHPMGNTHPLNNAIGVLLRSYTRAINIQENRTGSLFQQKTKARNLDRPTVWKNSPNDRYNQPLVCFNYIHQNPLESGMVSKMEDWSFSSFRDYAEMRKKTICNTTLFYDLFPVLNKENFYQQSYRAVMPDNIDNLF